MNQFTVRPEHKRDGPATRPSRVGANARTLYLLLAGCLFLIPAFFRSRYALGMVAWDICVLVAAIVDGARLPAPPAIDVRREWLGAPSLGREVEVEVAVTQHSRSLSTAHCSTICRRLSSTNRRATRSTRILKRTPPCVTPSSLRSVAIIRQAGFICATARTSAWRSAGRWPISLRPSASIRRCARRRRIGSILRGIIASNCRCACAGSADGRDFESLRDYLEGDENRDICWTASARRGALVTRNYEMEKSQAVWLVLDAGRLQGARVGRYTKLDQARPPR